MARPLLHPLTHAPLFPVGTFKGRPIWPILGGAPDDGDGSGGDGGSAAAGGSGFGAQGSGNDGSDGTPADLGDAGKKALAAERQRADDAEKRAKKAEADADKLRKQSQTAEEAAIEAAREEGRASATTELTRERVADKIEVAAAGKFHDIEDAVLHLGSRADEFVKDGKPDTAAISKAIDVLLEAKPHLGMQNNGGQQQRRPNFDQGHRTNDKPSAKEQADAQLARRFPQAAPK